MYSAGLCFFVVVSYCSSGFGAERPSGCYPPLCHVASSYISHLCIRRQARPLPASWKSSGYPAAIPRGWCANARVLILSQNLAHADVQQLGRPAINPDCPRDGLNFTYATPKNNVHIYLYRLQALIKYSTHVCTSCDAVSKRRTPQLTLVVAGGGYLGFLVLFLPLYAVSFLVTATGAWFMLLGAVYMGGRGLTRTISYPGASKQIQRDIELEYTKSVSGRLVRGPWACACAVLAGRGRTTTACPFFIFGIWCAVKRRVPT